VRTQWEGGDPSTTTLAPGWTELRLALPEHRAGRVERLTFRWSERRQASDEDARRLAARLSRISFD